MTAAQAWNPNLPPLPLILPQREIFIPPRPQIIMPEPAKVIEFPNVQRYLNKPVELQSKHMMKLWRHRPKIFLHDNFDLVLDAWQEEVVELYITHQRVGLVASKGPGKTFTLACLGWHFFICHHQPKIAALSITKDHLMSNLWAELARLRSRSPLVTKSTNESASRFTLKGHELYSFIDARSFPKQADNNQMASALAGLHAEHVGFLIDEAGMVPDAILATADAALTTGDSETTKARLLVTGNPEVAQGMLYRASRGTTEQKWGMYHISGDPDDPKRAPRVSVSWAKEQIATFGKDDPWVLVNVFGKYPPTAMNTLLSEEEIESAMKKDYSEKEVSVSQTRMGVDVARGGVDRSAFAKRKGLKAYPIELYPSNILGPELAGKIVTKHQDEGIERVFVDDTGGYGSSVIDSLQLFPTLDVSPVKFNASAQDARKIYFNKRTEMWVRMRDWIRKGGQLPYDPQLKEELMMPKLIFHEGKFRLEAKEQIKVRLGGKSPDRADALAMTFADPEQASMNAFGVGMQSSMSNKEFIEHYHRQVQGNYISQESQIDNYHQAAPNYRS